MDDDLPPVGSRWWFSNGYYRCVLTVTEGDHDVGDEPVVWATGWIDKHGNAYEQPMFARLSAWRTHAQPVPPKFTTIDAVNTYLEDA